MVRNCNSIDLAEVNDRTVRSVFFRDPKKPENSMGNGTLELLLLLIVRRPSAEPLAFGYVASDKKGHM